MFRLLKQNNLIDSLIYLFVFLLPLQTRWIFVDSDIPFQQMSIYAFDIVLIAVVVIWFFKGIKNSDIKIPSGFDTKNRYHWIILISCFLLIISLISVIRSFDVNLSLYWSIRLLLGITILHIIPKTSVNIRKLSIVLALAITIQATLGIAQFLTQSDIITSKWLGMAPHDASVSGTSVIETSDGRWLRAYGSQPHPNVLGGLIVIGMILVSYLIQTLEFKKSYEVFIIKRLSLVACYILLAISLLLTFSRSAWVAISIIAIACLAKRLSKPLKPASFAQIAILPIITIISLYVAIYPSIIDSRLDASGRLEQRSITERVAGISEARDMIQAKPILGVGIGTYTKTLQQKNPQREDYDIQPVHNVYLLVFAELGIAGLIALIIIIALNIVIPKQSRELAVEKTAFATILVSLLLLGLFDHYLWTLPSMFFIWWLIMSVIQRANLEYRMN